MEDQNVRRLTKTSVFSAEVLMAAPDDLGIIDRSNKYRILRKDLAKALANHAWGLRLTVVAETPDECKKSLHGLMNAAKAWERAMKLPKTHGKKVRTSVKTDLDNASQARLDIFFEKETGDDVK